MLFARKTMHQLPPHANGIPESYEDAVREFTRLRSQMLSLSPLIQLGSVTIGIINQVSNQLSRPMMSCDMLLASSNLSEGEEKRIACIKGDLTVFAQLVRLIGTDFRPLTQHLVRPHDADSEVICIADLLEYVRSLAFHRAEFKQRLIEIKVNVSPCKVTLPTPLLRFALLSLVFNGVDATNIGQIVLKGEVSPDCIRFDVTDTGEGMSEEVLKRCLEPFFSTQPQEEATGCGLTLAHQIITSVGGTLEIDSHVGKGTRCTVKIPHTP